MMREDDNLMERDEYRPLREVVFLTLRRQILRGELKPGERLMEISLANRLGVSRTPVREAIRQLEHEGLVDMLPRRGARVADISQKELRDVLEIRRSLELLAIDRICGNITEEDMEQLKEAEQNFETITDNPDADLAELGEADEHFHDLIYRGTDNHRLVQMLNHLREQMYRFRLEYLKDHSYWKKLAGEHRGILAALAVRDREEAARLMALHIDNQYRAVLRQLDARNAGGD